MKSSSHKVFYILIPIGVIVLGIVCNIIFDKYHEIRVKNDTKEVLEYIVTKEFDEVDKYTEAASEQFKLKGYDENDTLNVILGDKYLVLVKYYSFNDLRTFFNIFHTRWVDSTGTINDNDINEDMARKSGLIVAKYIARLNEYNEPVIEEFNEDENELFLQTVKEKEQETTQIVESN
jgi:hypothetical protein